MDAPFSSPVLLDPAAIVPVPAGPDDGSGGDIDRHLFGRIVGFATNAPASTEALGLSRADLARLIAQYVPDQAPLLDRLPAGAGPGEDAVEEPDVRAYLLECRAGRGEAEAWLAAIVARRCQQPNHLWQDMGFAHRGELNAMFCRHFPELVRRNARDMKWKKFLYRELCARDGMLICKSPVCDTCSDFAHCFGGEDGEPLDSLAALGR